jgi:hypothetical protein
MFLLHVLLSKNELKRIFLTYNTTLMEILTMVKIKNTEMIERKNMKKENISEMINKQKIIVT